MPRNIEDIQQDISRTRSQLANTLDQLADRARPQAVVEDAKRSIVERLKDPKVQKVLAGVAVVVAAGVAFSIARSRRRSKDMQELKQLIAQRSGR